MNISIKKVILYLLIAAGAASTVTANTGLPLADLHEDYMQVSSSHFRVTYPLSLSSLAPVIAEEAEYVYGILSAWTGYNPHRTIDILLTDDSDFANGYTTYGPRGLFMALYAVYPYATFTLSIDEYRNWYRHLLIHEMSHYFHLNRVEGLPKIARKILGNIIYPNSTTPLHIREGFATYSETKNGSGFGRGNSPYTDMLIDAAVFNEDFTPLDRAANRSAVWPGSGNYYLFGVSFFNYLARMYGEEKILHFNETSARCTPYTWGIAFKKEYGKTMHEMWDEWEEYEKNLEQYSAKNMYEGRMNSFTPIGKKLGTVHSLTFDPEGKRLAYSMSTPDDTGGIYVYDFNQKKEKRLKADRAAYNLRFSPDSTHLFYIRVERFRNVNFRKNIYTLDIHKKKEKRVTRSGHIQSFSFLPGMDVILACISSPEGTLIHLLDYRGNTIGTPELHGADLPVVLEEPAISPDGRRIAFSGKLENGKRAIFTASLQQLFTGSCTLSRIDAPVHSMYSPAWLDSHELMFVGGDSGSFNLYTVNLDELVFKRITDVPTGIFRPVFGRGILAACEYTTSGFRPVYIKTENLLHPSNRYTETKRTYQSEADNPGQTTVAPRIPNTSTVSDPKQYRSYTYLAPSYWLPVWCSDTINLGFGFHTHGGDLLNRHQYDFSLMYDVFDSKVKNEFGYNFNTALLSFSIDIFLSQDPYADSFAPAAAFKPTVTYPVLKSGYIFSVQSGAIFESPFSGPDFNLYFSNTKVPPLWDRPKKGISVSHELFFNSMSDNFAVSDSRVAFYYAPIQFLLFNLSLRNKTGFGDFDEYIQSGNSSHYVYAPLNGVRTRGYPMPVPGKSVTDCRINTMVPVLRLHRGIFAFPVFLKTVYLNLYSDSAIVFADSSPYSFVAESMEEFAASPLTFIRSSVGVEITLSTIVGYEFPFEITAGYVYPFSSLGESSIYLDARRTSF